MRDVFDAGLVILFAVAMAMVLAGPVKAEPVARATSGPATITLYDEPCEKKDEIRNLPLKARWEEGGKVFEGCYQVVREAQLVMCWFDDRTLAIIPFVVLRPVSNT